ncbi:hypothetical protein [Undibacterium pigrum]|uniref:Uncharacterized protein n=1 Tax=Undibacterium pigrum TaxID=401470 RepID=A0A318JDU7_9BURK|nr:hypothetical protein [Undibacterium pigrum]PXX47768.1 hypothetical protein DFR42_1011366 [Undibacterium pigrum]
MLAFAGTKKKDYVSLIACGVFFSACSLSTSSLAKPLLRCYVSYAGSEQTIESQIVQDPYDVKASDIGERFTFKAVMVGKAQQIDYIKLYAYFQTRRSDIPVHQATYRPPFKVTKKESPLTPQNSIYAGDVERELQYHCTLQEVQ